jgi:hypothetical protein
MDRGPLKKLTCIAELFKFNGGHKKVFPTIFFSRPRLSRRVRDRIADSWHCAQNFLYQSAFAPA